MKMFAIIRMKGGSPDIDQEATPYKGFVLCDQVGNFGAYLISGTAGQLTAIDALPQVVGIVAVTESGETRWKELDGTISSTVRNRLNTWLTNNRPDWEQIPAGANYRQLLRALFKRFNIKFDLNSFDIAE